jgi:hypothetical protein
LRTGENARIFDVSRKKGEKKKKEKEKKNKNKEKKNSPEHFLSFFCYNLAD